MKTIITKLSIELSINAGIGLGYYFLGSMALFLAIPPGFASPIWPAAGLALAMVLCRGLSVLPGIFLGSLFTNLSVSDQTINTLTLTDYFMPSLIAIGATAQAVVGNWLIRRFMDWPDPLETQKNIIRFVYLAGPCSSLVASIMGNLVLFNGGIISLTDLPFSIATWWWGDMIGIIVCTPLILSIQGSTVLWRKRLLQVSLPIILINTSISILFFEFKVNEMASHRSDFTVLVKTFTAHLESEIKLSQETLLHLRDLMTSGVVDRQRFDYFVETSLARHNNVHALSWNPIVFDTERPTFEADASKDWGQPFSIKERDEHGTLKIAASREKYVTVKWIYPFESNKQALGFDVSSNPIRRAALEQARKTGLLAATEKVSLVQEKNTTDGILLFAYTNLKKDTEPHNTSYSDGFVVGVFKITDIIEKALDPFSKHLWDIHIFSPSVSLEKRLIYTNAHETQQEDIDTFNTFDSPSSTIVDLAFANQVWRIVVIQPPIDNYLLYSWLFIISGLSFSSILGIFLLINTGKVSQAETARSKMAEELLDQSIKTNKQLEIEKRELDLRSQELQLANTSLTRFTYAASHDIREPLRTIRSYAEIIQMEYQENLPADGQVCLQNIAKGAEILDKRIKTLLEYTRLGDRVLVEEQLSIKQIIDATLEGLKQAIEERGAVISVGTLGMFKGNAELLQQVTENLLHNALKFASKTSPEISISEERTLEHVIITVADNGDGIPLENREKAFELFSRLDRQQDGHGIGLALCRQIIELHKGKIWLQDNLPRGTQARFKLPL